MHSTHSMVSRDPSSATTQQSSGLYVSSDLSSVGYIPPKHSDMVSFSLFINTEHLHAVASPNLQPCGGDGVAACGLRVPAIVALVRRRICVVPSLDRELLVVEFAVLSAKWTTAMVRQLPVVPSVLS